MTKTETYRRRKLFHRITQKHLRWKVIVATQIDGSEAFKRRKIHKKFPGQRQIEVTLP